MKKFFLLLVAFIFLATGRGLSASLNGINQDGKSEVLTTTLAHGFPVIVITTEDGSMPTVDIVSPPEGAMGYGSANATKIPGSVERYEPDGTCSFSSGDYVKSESGMTIKIRGNSSSHMERKPYKIKLQKKADLLNRGDKNLNDKNWALLTLGAWRNWMAMKLSREISRQWAPDCEWVNVIFNGQYHGLYLLAETIERNNKGRINVADDGFIVEKDPYWWTEDGEYIPSVLSPRYAYTLKYPDFEDLDEDGKEYIKTTLDPLLEKLEQSGYDEHIDLDSWIDFVLLHDLMGTNDAGGCNLYFIKYDRDSKIGLGPAWDFDSAGLSSHLSDTHRSEHYMNRLFNNQDRTFVRKYVERFDEVAEDAYAMIERMIEEGPCDEEMFSRSKAATDALVSNNIFSHAEARDMLGSWLPQHKDTHIEYVNGLRESFSSVAEVADGSANIRVEGNIVKGAGLLPGQEVKVYTFDGGQLQNGNVAPDGCFELTLPNHAGLLIIHSGTLVKKVMIK